MLPRLAKAALRRAPARRSLYVRGEKQPKEDHKLFYVAGAVGVSVMGYYGWQIRREELRREAGAAAAAGRSPAAGARFRRQLSWVIPIRWIM